MSYTPFKDIDIDTNFPLPIRKVGTSSQWLPDGEMVSNLHYAPYYVPKPHAIKSKGQFQQEQFWSYNPSLAYTTSDRLVSVSGLRKCKSRITSIYGNNSNIVEGYNTANLGNVNLIALHPSCYDLWHYIPTFFHLNSLHSAAGALFGQNYFTSGVLQSVADRFFIDFILTSYPSGKFLVEFGTASGMTSVYLGISAKMRDGILVTFDIHDARVKQSRDLWNDSYMVRMYEDILTADGNCKPFNCPVKNMKVAETVSKADIWIIDNGEKLKETYLYSKYLPVGSIALVHDMTLDATQYYLFNQVFRYWGYKPLFLDLSMSVGTHMRAWKRVTNEPSFGIEEPDLVFGKDGGYQ